MSFQVPEKYRLKHPDGGERGENVGAFLVPFPSGPTLRVIASDEFGWEHVSVSLPNRCPQWEEMDFVKDLFWDATDTVVQFHVPKDSHINFHRFCLHLWRAKEQEFPIPDPILI